MAQRLRSRRAGLGVLDHTTVMGPTKTTTLTEVEAFGRRFTGYEIRHGLVTGEPFVSYGRITATTVHGLFEHPEFVERLLGVEVEPVLERTFDLLADTVEQHLDTAWLRSLL